MSDIENGLRFKISKYFLNYYLISNHLFGEENAGADWSKFIEYGTTDKKMIELQNLGLSRTSSTYLIKKHADLFIFDEEDKLIKISSEILRKKLHKENEYYEEIIECLF